MFNFPYFSTRAALLDGLVTNNVPPSHILATQALVHERVATETTPLLQQRAHAQTTTCYKAKALALGCFACAGHCVNMHTCAAPLTTCCIFIMHPAHGYQQI